MRNKIIARILKPFICSEILGMQRSYTSALYIPGNKAHKTFAYVTPELDFDNSFIDMQQFQNELHLRNIKIDVKELQKSWKFYQYINSNKAALKQKLAEISNQIKEIKQNENLSFEDNKNIEALITQSQLVKQDLKATNEIIWELQETLIPEMLKLPNKIDKQTPLDDSIVLKRIGEKINVSETVKQNHLDIGKSLGLIEYKNAIQYYLFNEAVFFELEVLALAGKILNENGITRVVAPDFCRSLVIEGCGIDHENPKETFIMQNTDNVEKEYLVNRLHLVGGASLSAIFAIFTKQAVKPKDLPIKVFAIGRQYTPFLNSPTSYGLFSTCQTSAVHALSLISDKSNEDYKTEFENLMAVTTKIYDEIGCHYQVVNRSVKELNSTESMRVSFEMWSPFLNQYIEVGHISTHGNYISKRLLIGQPWKKNSYVKTIAGTLLSVPRVLGCLLEENPAKFSIPEKMTKFSPFKNNVNNE